MNKNFYIITILICFIFICNQINYFRILNINALTNRFDLWIYIFMGLFVLSLFLKYGTKSFNRLENTSFIISLISMASISFIANNIFLVSLLLTCFLGYANIILGIVGLWKYKHKVNLSFLIWGIFVLKWTYNFYNFMYPVGTFEYWDSSILN